MSTGVIETKGTKLYFAGRTTSPGEILKVACPTAITGLGGPGDQKDVTCLDSDEMEFRRGMKNPGQISVPINFIPQSLSHQTLQDLDDSGDIVDWMIVMSDQPLAPTATTTVGGVIHITSPGATSVRFQAYVSDLTVEIATNEYVRATLTLQRSGAKEWDMPTAIYD